MESLVENDISKSQVRQQWTSKNDLSDAIPENKLDPTDTKGRTRIKVEAREQKPAVMKAVAEQMRPIEKEASRISGTASKTNVGVNNMVKGW